MMKRFSHKGINAFFETGSKAGIQAAHARRLRLQLAALNRAKVPADMASCMRSREVWQTTGQSRSMEIGASLFDLKMAMRC